MCNKTYAYGLEDKLNEQEETIDLRVLLKVLTGHIIPIVIAAILAAGAGFSLAKFIIPKRYTSEALMYVENSSGKQEDSSININDINAAQKLVNTCQILFTSNYVFDELSAHFGNKYSAAQLRGMVNISSVNNTEVLKVSVETDSPQESYDVATELIKLSISEFQRIIKGGSIETVSSPTFPETHTYPSAFRFTIIAGAIGAVVMYIAFFIKEMLDTKLKPGDDLAQIYDIPVFAEILDFETTGKAGYKYSKYGDYDNENEDESDKNREETEYSEEYEKDRDPAVRTIHRQKF